MTLPLTFLFAALEFTSLPMLGWLAAAALPWLIHRWQRKHHRATPWAAVELLLSAMRQRARRVQMQQWLLLAVRTAILVLVALAVAEPTLRQWAVGVGGKVRTHRIVVVDQSYSMGCKQLQTSRWQRALAEARRSIETSAGEPITVIGWARQAENLIGRPTFDSSVALAVLEDLRLSESSVELSTATQAILTAIQRSEAELPQETAHHVMFYTDLGRQTWQVDNDLRQQLESLAERAQVTVISVADNRPDNVAVTSLSIEPAMTLVQREATFAATITCFGEAPRNAVVVELRIEGRRVDQQKIQLRSDGETTARFKHRFVDEGTHSVQVVLPEHEEGLPSDNARWLVVDVRPKLRVACFAGQPGVVDDLARALAPRTGLAESEGTFKPEILSVSQLSELDLSNYAAIFLGSVAELPPREAMTLTDYVRQGGGLAMFLGPESADEPYSTLKPLLPVHIEHLQRAGEYRFDPLEFRHPIVSPFRGQAQSGLLRVAISQYRSLQILSDRPSTEVALAFDTGDPALVVDRFGLGRVAIMALPGSLAVRTDTGSPWSSFALSPSFLPVIRELVAYLVGDGWLQQRNLLVGEPAIFARVAGAKRASVRLPEGVRQTLPLTNAEDRGQRVFRETDQRGIYQFSANDQECARFAINLDGRDSDLTPLDPAALPRGFSCKPSEGHRTLSAVVGSISLARILLAGALVLLLLEIGLAWLLGRGWG